MLRLIPQGIVMCRILLLLPLMLILMWALIWHVALAVGRIGKSHHRSAAPHWPIVPLIVLPLRSGLVFIRARRSVSIALVAVVAVAMRRLVLSELQ